MTFYDLKSSRVRLAYALRTAGVSRSTWFRKTANHPLAPITKTELDGSVTFDRSEVDRFVKALKARRI